MKLRDAIVPLLVFAAALGLWEWIVAAKQIPPYVLPAPSAIFAKLIADRALLFSSLTVTLGVTLKALAIATLCGVALALLLAQSKWLERALLPFAIVLQVTPVIAIAPLLLVYMKPDNAVLVCAFLVAFFPILSNTALGLASVDHALRDLFQIVPRHRLAEDSCICVCRRRCRNFSPACASAAGWRSSARLSRSWRRARPVRARGLPIASSKRASGSTFRACSQRWR